MDDVQLYIYIALGLIYFFSRAFKKKKSVRPNQNSPQQTFEEESYENLPEKEKSLTFEDLLKEFSGEKTEKHEEVEEVEVIKEEAVTNARAIEVDDEARTYAEYDSYKYEETINYDDPVSKPTYSAFKKDSLVSGLSGERFSEYETHTASNRIRDLLKNKQSIRDAIILKEVLETKYF